MATTMCGHLVMSRRGYAFHYSERAIEEHAETDVGREMGILVLDLESGLTGAAQKDVWLPLRSLRSTSGSTPKLMISS